MTALLNKELRLATPSFAYAFLAFTAMTFIPGYPILCGAFFVCLGMFQAYQYARESNDILFSLLLPVKKTDIVKAKYLFACAFEAVATVLFALFTLARMTLMANAEVYRQNVLMAANPVFLAFVLLIFAAFNVIFLGGFFKTAYRFGKPFVLFIVVGFVIIGIAETLHHIPGFGFLNAIDSTHLPTHLGILAAAAIIYVIVTILSCKAAEKRFNALDL